MSDPIMDRTREILEILFPRMPKPGDQQPPIEPQPQQPTTTEENDDERQHQQG